MGTFTGSSIGKTVWFADVMNIYLKTWEHSNLDRNIFQGTHLKQKYAIERGRNIWKMF